VSCLNAHGMSKDRSSQFATSADFGELFMDDSHWLCLLSILRTADHEKAERCFIVGPGECINGNSVFHEWAHSWSRWMTVRNAVRLLTLIPGPCVPESSATFAATSLQDPFLARVLVLEDFERLVYGLSALEEYPDQNCAVLSGVSPQRIRETRIPTLRHISHFDS
jgi:hypothetical protein